MHPDGRESCQGDSLFFIGWPYLRIWIFPKFWRSLYYYKPEGKILWLWVRLPPQANQPCRDGFI